MAELAIPSAATMLALLGLVLVLFAPGTAIMALSGMHRELAPVVRPLVALALSLAVSAVTLGVTIATGRGIETSLVAWCVITGGLAVARLAQRATALRTEPVHVLAELVTWPLAIARSGTNVTVAAALVAATAAAVWVRTEAASVMDSALVTRLLADRSMRAADLSILADGSPGRDQIVPAWQHGAAMVASAFDVSAGRVVDLLPVLIAGALVLGTASLARCALASYEAEQVAAVGSAIVVVGWLIGLGTPDVRLASSNVIALGVLVPAAWALAMAATAGLERGAIGASAHGDRSMLSMRHTLAASAACTLVAVVLVQVSALWLTAAIIAGVVVRRALGPLPAQDSQRIVTTAAAVLVTAAVGVVAALLLAHQASPGLQRGVQWISLPPAGGFDYVLVGGALTLLAVAGSVACHHRVRDVRLWQLVMGGLLMLLIIGTIGPLVDQRLQPPSVGMSSLLLAWQPGVIAGMVVVASLLGAWWWRPGGRSAATFSAVALGLVVAALADAFAPAPLEVAAAGPAIVSALFIAAVGMWAIRLPAARRMRAADGDRLDRLTWSLSTPGMVLSCLAASALLVPSLPGVRGAPEVDPTVSLRSTTTAGIERATRGTQPRLLARPATGAVAATHIAVRPLVLPRPLVDPAPRRNRVILKARTPLVESFLEGWMTERQRLRLLTRLDVDALLLDRTRDASAVAFARRHPDVLRIVASDGRMIAYVTRNSAGSATR